MTRVQLRHEEDFLLTRHGMFKRRHRFVATDKQRHDHVRENHNVTKGQKGKIDSHSNSVGRIRQPVIRNMGFRPALINA